LYGIALSLLILGSCEVGLQGLVGARLGSCSISISSFRGLCRIIFGLFAGRFTRMMGLFAGSVCRKDVILL